MRRDDNGDLTRESLDYVLRFFELTQEEVCQSERDGFIFVKYYEEELEIYDCNFNIVTKKILKQIKGRRALKVRKSLLDKNNTVVEEKDMRLTFMNRLKLCFEILTIKSNHKHAAFEKNLSTFQRGYQCGLHDGSYEFAQNHSRDKRLTIVETESEDDASHLTC